MNETIDTTDLIGRYIAAWNETDPEQRHSLITRTFADAVSFVDPMMEGHGHSEIDALIKGVQERFPGLRFRLTGTVDAHHTNVRFSWELVPTSGQPVAKGTDFAVLAEDGRLRSVTGFFDAVATQ